MNINRIISPNFWLRNSTALIIAALLMIGSLGSSAWAQDALGAEKALWTRYQAALADAAVVEPSEIHELRPLFDANTQNTKVVAWNNWAGYRKGEWNTLGVDVWVVALSELQDAARKFPPDMDEAALRLRLCQLYGLPPQVSYDRFVVMSVNRGLTKRCDIFRPTADPDVTKIWPGASATDFRGVTAFPDCVPPVHALWMASQSLSSYQITPTPGVMGFPWTRLGYTYDWMPGAPEYGLSEYVVRRGATVEVTDIQPTSEFFKTYITALPTLK